jgi:hypothetical protein
MTAVVARILRHLRVNLPGKSRPPGPRHARTDRWARQHHGRHILS